MPSKKSKPKKPPSPHKSNTISHCSEAELEELARDLGRQLKTGDRVLLEGPMGAGKSTFARALIRALGGTHLQAGSPTFALAFHYPLQEFALVHMDLYRLNSEAELEEAGLLAAMFEESNVVLCEWLDRFPEIEKNLRKLGCRVMKVRLQFVSDQDKRSVEILKS